MSIGEGAAIDFATARSHDYPSIRQFTIFLENRVGQLLEVVRRFEGSHVTIVGLSISDATECAFVRIVLSRPEQGREILERAGLTIIESDLLCVELPAGPQPLVQVCSALLQAEINIIQAYPLIVHPRDNPVMALLVDNLEAAAETLESKGFRTINEDDLAECD
ncbi:MAG: acetolactate synthase [Candidatus Anammoximicrobium sp.]|nr:acetolactate synthase [Candidatus Anammoximicrobium sp.]